MGDQPNGIYTAMVAVMKEIEPISKARTNQQQKFNFRGVEDFYNVLQPIMAKHGVFCTMEIIDDKFRDRTTASGNLMIQREITYRVNFIASDGSQVSTEAKGEAMDTGDKASNKCASIAHKYALATTFLVPYAEMDDPDEHSPTARVIPATDKQAPPVAPKGPSFMNDGQKKAILASYKSSHPGKTAEEYDTAIQAELTTKFGDVTKVTHDQAVAYIVELQALLKK